MTSNESVYKYRRLIRDFRDYLIYMSMSKKIRENDRIYVEYIKLLRKYDEVFDLNDI